MLATDEVSVFEPRFNSLLCWDARVPVGVRQVEGSDDALDARVVLHGYFGRPAPFASGSLAQQDVEPVLQAAAGGLHAALQRGGHQAAGLVTVRLEVAPDGRVAALRWLCNTLIAHPQLGRQPWVEVDAILSQVAEACLELRFPASRGGGEVTLPLALA